MSWSTPLTALPHLSDEAVAAFADGVLSGAARQRAQSHLAECAECSDAVRGQRLASAFLRGAMTPTLPAGLAERLRELPITTSLPGVHFAAALAHDGQPVFASFVPAARIEPPPRPAAAEMAPRPAAAETAPRRIAPALPSLAAGRRRHSTRAGLGAAAAAAVAVGVLASTAAAAGGVTPVRAPSVPSVRSGASWSPTPAGGSNVMTVLNFAPSGGK